MALQFFIVLASLLALMLCYIRVADKFNIVDSPNLRSSHIKPTITGGGVVFPLSMLIGVLFFRELQGATHTWLLCGMLAICAVSFWDDIVTLPIRLRIIVHLLAVTMLLIANGLFAALPWFWIPVIYVVVIGTINAYNFMDGINGMTGLYSLSVLISCYYFNEKVNSFVQPFYIYSAIAACIIFLVFNFRTKAVLFAGDVGSVGIGFWVISILLFLIVSSGNLKYVLFLSVYGVDTVLTIVFRLKARQNIFKPHRLHLYQLLCNEGKMPQLLVTVCYACLQIIINYFVIVSSLHVAAITVIVCSPLIVLYLVLQRRFVAFAGVK